jgi:hypothetical protein
MFHTEHNRLILTSPSESTSLRRDAGECNCQLYPRRPVVVRPAKVSVVPAFRCLGPRPVDHGQRNRLNSASQRDVDAGPAPCAGDAAQMEDLTNEDIMNHNRFSRQMIGLLLVMLLLAACSTPTPVPGIDEPVLVGDMRLRVIEAYTEDVHSSATGTKYPDDPSHTFLSVLYEAGAGTGGTEGDRLFHKQKLVCDGEEYERVLWGIKLGEGGKFAGTYLLFSVPKESKFSRCTLRLSEGVSIDLARFFE